MSGPAGSYDCLLFDVGGTLVEPAAPGTPLADLVPMLRPQVAADLLRLASRYRVGAMTNTSTMREPDVRAHLRATGIDGVLEVVVTSVDVGAEKPDPRGIAVAMERLGVDASRTLYVGDLASDRHAAHRAGCDFAFVRETLAATVDDHLSRAGRPFHLAARAIPPLDTDAMRAAEELHARLAKPAGSLGAIEAVGVRLAGIAGACPPPDPFPASVAVLAADHGVAGHGVTMWPSALTPLIAGVVASGGAGVSAIASVVGADVRVVDIGMAGGPSGAEGVHAARVRPGTGNLAVEPAMTERDALAALDAGVELAAELVAGGARCLVTGEVGIGNTTSAAAVVAALTGMDGARVAGRGAGADDATLARKVAAIDAGLERLRGVADPVRVLAEVGGLEIAALAGLVVGAARHRVPVLVDGAIACSALLVAAELAPTALGYAIPGHRSAEPAGGLVLDRLGLSPLLDLGMRLGEGSGACLALPLVRAAARVMSQMATLDDLAG